MPRSEGFAESNSEGRGRTLFLQLVPAWCRCSLSVISEAGVETTEVDGHMSSVALRNLAGPSE